jgi:hypothetical protein
MPKGELSKDPNACLRRTQSKLIPRSRGEGRRRQMPDLLRIHRAGRCNGRFGLGGLNDQAARHRRTGAQDP